MLTKLAASAGLAAVSSQYVELNLDNRVGQDDSTTEYYKDATSTARIPNWLTKKEYGLRFLNPDGTQTASNADLSHSAIWLGDGENVFSGGSSSSAQKAFIDSVQDHHDRDLISGQLRQLPFHANNDNTVSRDPYDHIDDFWLRDGQVFAKISSNFDQSSIHGDQAEFMQNDVYMNRDDESYQVREQANHLEHLRSFCNHMGGDLWSPASQQEYDDIMEREGGVCDRNPGAEIYLNMHRDGYLGCPAGYDRVNMGDETDLNRRSCPDSRNMDDNREAFNAQYKTTDAWFADDLENGMCANPNSNAYHYSSFRSADCSQRFNDINNVPFLREECWHDTTNMRFQKFGSDTSLDTIQPLAGEDSFQTADDCVVASCANSVSNNFVGSNDVRYASQWKSDTCNRDITAICRIRAFGCSDVAYNCKNNYSRSCGERSVLVKSIVSWANADVHNSRISLYNDMVAANQLSVNQRASMTAASIPTLRDSWTGEVMLIPFWYSSNDEVSVRNWLLNEISNIYINDDIEIERQDLTKVYPVCDCQCNADGSLLDFNALVATVQNDLDLQVDTNRGLTHVLNQNFASNNVNDVVTWSCQDNLGCYTGSFSAECSYIAGGTYQAGWSIDSDTYSRACINNCCGMYNDNIHQNAAMTSSFGKNVYSWKVGETYTVTCDSGFHISGMNDDDVTFTHEITAEDLSSNSCFKKVNCVRNIPDGQCGDYNSNVHSFASMNNLLTTQANALIWQEGDEYTIECDADHYRKGFEMDVISYTHVISAEDIEQRTCFIAIECCRITSYSDDTSTYRTPNWMKGANNPYTALVNGLTGIQSGDVWREANSAVHLGNGRVFNQFTQADGTSTVEEREVIQRIKAHHNINGASTNYVHQSGVSSDPYDFVEDFYLRDGHLFAVIENNNVDSMIHGNNVDNMQKDIRYNNGVARSQNTFVVTREAEHMENMRQFCNDMGGDLWMPSSEQEYLDIFENGACNNNNQNDVYLNVHKKGYLGCPTDAQQVNNDNLADLSAGEVSLLFCPDEYDENPRDFFTQRPVPSRVMTTNHNFREYRTTDSYFGDSMSDMCSAPDNEHYHYGNYGCQATSDIMRFQKFHKNDMDDLTDILTETFGNDMYQKDCVIAKCKNDGTSVWRTSRCNAADTTGICRIRAFGCSDSVYNCKVGYNRSCNDRSVYTKTVANWVNFSVDSAINSLISARRLSNDLSVAQENMLASAHIQQWRQDTMTGDIILVPEDYNNDDLALVESWRQNVAELQDITVIENRLPTKSYDLCQCQCSAEGSLNNFAEMQNIIANTQLQVDSTRGLTHVQSWDQTISNNIGDEAAWRCDDDYDCYSGAFIARCGFVAGAPFEASWGLLGSTNACVNTCCPLYDDSIHNGASMRILNSNRPSNYAWRAGDQYTIQCDDINTHILGGNNDYKSETFTITAEERALGSCFRSVTCVQDVVFDVNTPCPTRYNDDIHVNAALSTDNRADDRDFFITGDTYTVACEAGTHVKFGPENIRSQSFRITQENVEENTCHVSVQCCKDNTYSDSLSDRTPDWMKLDAHWFWGVDFDPIRFIS